MTGVHDPFQVLRDLADRAEQAGSDPSNERTLALHKQVVKHLTRLQAEYQRIHDWLREMQDQITRRETQVRQQLREALAVADRPADPVPDASGSPSVDVPLLFVQTLGEFSVRYQDSPLSMGSNRNGRAIFRYLVAHPGRRVAKQVLLGLFWPDDPPDKAAHKLHIAISAVRQALSETLGSTETILFGEDHYALAPDLPLQVDTQVFVEQARAGERLEQAGEIQPAIEAYQAAIEIYRGDFLVEDLYEDWTTVQRARLEEIYLTVLGRLSLRYAEQGNYDGSISCCRQILARDSFREDAYRQLMCCYSRLGRRNQALSEYQQCQAVLKRELGIEPMRETTELYERIARQDPV